MIFQRISYLGFWKKWHSQKTGVAPLRWLQSFFCPVFYFHKNRPVSTCTGQPIASVGGCRQCSQPQSEKEWRASHGLLGKNAGQSWPGRPGLENLKRFFPQNLPDLKIWRDMAMWLKATHSTVTSSAGDSGRDFLTCSASSLHCELISFWDTW